MSRLPVIIGIGEITDRPSDPAHSLEPIALMAEALRRAERDIDNEVLSKLDSLDVVHQVSWRYEKTAARLCQHLGIKPQRAIYGVTGGESPIRYIHEAALRIAQGESEFAAVVNGEAQYAVNKSKTSAVDLPWTPIATEVENPFPVEGRLNSLAIAHGVIRPIHVYPFYENASHHAWGQLPREAAEESGALWSRFSQVAAANPYAWSNRAYSAAEVVTPSADNRLICYPYTKRMVANPAVNQGAAVVLTSLERARQMHIDESRLIFVWGGAVAHEPRDYLQREQYERSDAQDAVLTTTAALLHDNHADLKALELYSCFPCVPKMTRRVLNLPVDCTPTVTGGLSFFGAPLNGYMNHATCAMVRHLRAGHAESGLLYGQGEFVTKHHAIAASRRPPRNSLSTAYGVQALVERRRGFVPPLLTEYEGQATIETHTVIYGRDGLPSHGVVIGRTSSMRTMARVSANDRDTLGALLRSDLSPIGLRGEIRRQGTVLQFHL